MQMKAITLRNIPPEVEKVICEKARESAQSLNRTVIHLLEETIGGRRSKKTRPLHHDLDALVGRWSADEYSAFKRSLGRQRVIDEELWK